MTRKINRFNWIAPYYDQLAAFIFGKSILEAQLCYLELIPPNAKILVLGGGTGKWISELIQFNNTCKIWFVDASSKMVELAKDNLKDTEQVAFIHGAEDKIPKLQFDVIITHFFLDMFTNQQLYNLIGKLVNDTNSPSMWIAADFEKSKYWHALLLRFMFLFFRQSGTMDNNELPDWNAILKSHRFKIAASKSSFGKFIQSRLYVKRSLIN